MDPAAPSADDVQWAQANFPADVTAQQSAAAQPPQPPEFPQPPHPGAPPPNTVFLTIQDIQAMTDRIVSDRLAAMEAHYRSQLARVEAEAEALRAAVQVQHSVPVPAPVPVPEPKATTPVAAQPARAAATARQPALSHDGSLLLPLRTRSPVVPTRTPAVSGKAVSPTNKFFLQDRRNTSNSDFHASDQRGQTLGSLTAGSVTNIGVGLQTRELWLNPSLRPPGIGGLI
jgi:hypothetical protein